ncbi:MAG: PDZ domain-containing protein [Bacteroidetes bacterium]|jgi:serine protease Do|nr:PDZ domain-containing protein [Bacteroidota bacterium]
MSHRYALLLLAALILVPAGLAQSGEDQKPKQKKGWLGVSIQTVTERIQKREKLPNDEGAYIGDVVDDSPADSAGLKRGDVIVSFGGKAIYEPDDLSRFVSRTAPGTRSEIVLYRDGARKTLTVVIGSEKSSLSLGHAIAIPSFPGFHVFIDGATLGVTAKSLNKQLGEYFGAPNNEGVLVEEVEKDKAGDKAGIKAGDVIIRIGKRTVSEVDDISKELRKAEAGDKMEVEVLRKGVKKTLTVEVTESDEFPHGRLERQYFRMHPGGAAMEWDGDEEGEAVIKFRRELDRVRELAPRVAPVPMPRISGSVTI